MNEVLSDMRSILAIGSLVVLLLAAWGSSLYVAQDWGYKQGQESKEMLLCQDALERRRDIERVIAQPFGPNDFPLETLVTLANKYSDFPNAKALKKVVERLQVKLVITELDIIQYCMGSQSDR